MSVAVRVPEATGYRSMTCQVVTRSRGRSERPALLWDVISQLGRGFLVMDGRHIGCFMMFHDVS